MTHTKCATRLRVHYKSKKGKYVVSIFEETRNHELTLSKFVHLHPIYRQIFEVDKTQINGLQSHGIKTCHVTGYMVAQKGRYNDEGFRKKDLYNYSDKKTCAIIKDGDVIFVLNHLNVKSPADPMLYVEYSVNSNGRFKSLIWTNDTSISDYLCFGDVLVLDTTYKKNKYNYLLVTFLLVQPSLTDCYIWCCIGVRLNDRDI